MAIISAKEQLVALFNEVNSSLSPALTVADITFGTVAAYTPADEGDTRDTEVTITATAEAGFTGNKVLHFTRLSPVGKLLTNQIVTDEWNNWETDDQIYTAFIAALAEKAEIVDTFAKDELTINKVDAEGVRTITVTVAAGHLKYHEGVAGTFAINVPAPVKVDLSTTNGELNGFTYPVA